MPSPFTVHVAIATVAAGQCMVVNVHGQTIAVDVPMGIQVGGQFTFHVPTPPPAESEEARAQAAAVAVAAAAAAAAGVPLVAQPVRSVLAVNDKGELHPALRERLEAKYETGESVNQKALIIEVDGFDNLKWLYRFRKEHGLAGPTKTTEAWLGAVCVASRFLGGFLLRARARLREKRVRATVRAVMYLRRLYKAARATLLRKRARAAVLAVVYFRRLREAARKAILAKRVRATVLAVVYFNRLRKAARLRKRVRATVRAVVYLQRLYKAARKVLSRKRVRATVLATVYFRRLREVARKAILRKRVRATVLAVVYCNRLREAARKAILCKRVRANVLAVVYIRRLLVNAGIREPPKVVARLLEHKERNGIIWLLTRHAQPYNDEVCRSQPLFLSPSPVVADHRALVSLCAFRLVTSGMSVMGSRS